MRTVVNISRWLDRAATKRFQIDTRALAVFRVCLGVLLLVDLGLRLPDLVAFHTDRGVLSRSALADLSPWFRYLSVHTLSGSAQFQLFLFGIAAIFALALVVGYRTTLSTVCAWYLLLSVQARNPLILSGGDTLLLALLFFGAFLPLGARYSLDAVRNDPRTGQIVGLHTEAVLFYVVALVYFVNGLSRTQSEIWMSGTAVQQILSLDSFTRSLGPYLLEYPLLLELLTWIWTAMLVTAPLLVLATGWWRVLLLTVFGIVHGGMILTLDLVIFPLANIAALTLFVPPMFWDRVEQRLPPVRPGFAGPVVSGLTTIPWFDREWHPPDRLRVIATQFSVIVLAATLILGSLWAVHSLAVANQPGGVQEDVPDYPWKVFSPVPLQTDGWYVAPTTLASGGEVDAYGGGRVTWDRPQNLRAEYPRPNWNHYLISGANRLHEADKLVREEFARYLCQRAEQTYDASVREVTVYFVADQPDRGTRRFLASSSC